MADSVSQRGTGIFFGQTCGSYLDLMGHMVWFFDRDGPKWKSNNLADLPQV